MQFGLLQCSYYIHIRQDGHLVNHIRAKHQDTISLRKLVRALTLLRCI
jgi:hypothetical protein